MSNVAKTPSALLLTATLAFAPGAALSGDDRPAFTGDMKPAAVVELYTSQGCSSCPPADALLGELAKRDGVIGLTFHVDYWDYIGWTDPFALPENGKRQRKYSGMLGQRHVFTPQMIIQGAVSAIGSDRNDVQNGIDQTRDVVTLPVRLRTDNRELTIEVGENDEPEKAHVYLIAFDDKHTTSIKRGENGGRTLSYYNVVRSWKRIGVWKGDVKTWTVPVGDLVKAGRSGCAVLVQSKKDWHIIGAAMIRFNRPS